MKRILVLALLMTIAAMNPAAAQEAADSTRASGLDDVGSVIADSGVGAAIDSIATTAGPQLEEALGELAATLGVIADRIANDPELRTSALRAAGGVVEIAQVVVAEQSDVILAVLRDAAERISVESPIVDGAATDTP